MACIIGLLDMLLMENLTVEHEGSVRQIHRCATSLVSLLNSALDIAKVESGKLVLEKAEFNLEAELTALIDVFSVQCDNKNLFISLDLAESVPTYVVGDSARVMQVFTNLIGNSIKFTSKGRIVVRGRVLNPESTNGSGRGHRRSFSPFTLDRTSEAVLPDTVVLVFEIDDTGPGIEPALREKVFENFVQGNASTTRIHGGTGLGLGIVRSLVNLMGGSIRIVEKNGVGAVFQFSICFQRAITPEAMPYSLPPFYLDTEVVIGVPDADTRVVASDWIAKRGLVVHQVETWEQILLHMRALHGRMPVDKTTNMKTTKSSDDFQKYFNKLDSGSDHSPRLSPGNVQGSNRYEFWRSWKNIGDKPSEPSGHLRQLMIIDTSLLPTHVQPSELEEYLQESGFLTGLSTQCLDDLGVHKWDMNRRQLRGMQQKLSVVWVMASNTHEPIKAALRAVRSSYIVRRPLHAARLKEIFHLVAQDSDILSSRQSENMPDVLASSTINYVKQQEWDDPYGCDTEVPLAQESSSRSGTTINRNVRHRPTAAKTVPLEEISYSEMEIKYSLPTDQTSQTASAPTKPMKRTIRTINHVNGTKKVSNAPKPLANLDILIAEDTPLLRKLAAAMLRRLGAVTHEASNGQEVLDAVMSRKQRNQSPFHCILMDCQMPVMDGYEACQAIREYEKEMSWRTAIVALTANAMASDEQKCLKAGMDAFLTKPIDQDYMVQIILRTMTPSFLRNSCTSSVKSSVHNEAPFQLQVSS